MSVILLVPFSQSTCLRYPYIYSSAFLSNFLHSYVYLSISPLCLFFIVYLSMHVFLTIFFSIKLCTYSSIFSSSSAYQHVFYAGSLILMSRFRLFLSLAMDSLAVSLVSASMQSCHLTLDLPLFLLPCTSRSRTLIYKTLKFSRRASRLTPPTPKRRRSEKKREKKK